MSNIIGSFIVMSERIKRTNKKRLSVALGVEESEGGSGLVSFAYEDHKDRRRAK